MKILSYIGLFAVFVILSGCCGTTAPSSSGFCPYGTYGNACTDLCSKTGGGEKCFSQCMDGIRSESLGDATTCCKTSFRQYCDQKCTALEASTHGDTTKSECMDNCIITISSVGVSPDSCYIPNL